MNVELQLGTIILSVHYYLSMELKQLQCAGHIFKLNMAVSTFLSPATALTARGPKGPGGGSKSDPAFRKSEKE